MDLQRFLAGMVIAVCATAAGAQDATDPYADVPEDITSELSESPSEDLAAAATESESAPEPLETIPVQPLQTEPEPAQVAVEAPRQIEEIIVTAQKTKQSAQKVPISISAVDAAFIQEVGAADIADLAPYLPNVRMDVDDLGSPQVFVRGFGTNTFNPSFESSVGFVQDEIYFGRAGYITEAMFDIDRIEVLRGPQGTLFGKNTIAGVFNVTSAEPSGPFSGNARLSFGRNNERRYEAGVGGMVGDTVGVRLSALQTSSDGQLHNGFLNRSEDQLEQSAQRIKLRFYPLENLSVELLGVESETNIAFWPYQLFQLDSGTRNYLAAFDPAIEDNPYDFRTSFDTPGYLEKGSSTAGVKTDWAIGDLGPLYDVSTVLVAAGSSFYINQLNDLDVSPADLLRLVNLEDYYQSTVELRFTGRANSLFGLGTGVEFVAGGYYFYSDYTLNAQIRAGRDLGSYILTDDFVQLVGGTTQFNLFSRLGLPPLPILGNILAPVVGEDWYQYDYTQNTRSKAFFGQMTWNLTPQWSITPGVRINYETKQVRTAGTAHCTLKDNLGLPICIVGAVLSANDYDAGSLERDERDVSPKIALQYSWDNDLNFYASYARGFKSGGFNSLSFTGEDLEFNAEKVGTYEVGMKGRFFDRTLRFNVSLYHNTFKDLQVLAFNGAFFDVSNAAIAKSQGLEADFTWLTPWTPLTINGTVGLLDARYDSYPEAPAPVSQGLDQLQDLSGERIAFAPRVTASLTPTLTLLFGDYMVRTGVDVLYQGDQYTDTDLDENTYVPAYTTLSARISFGPQAGPWSLSVGGSNLTDKRVLNQVTDALLFPGTYYAQQSAGRQVFAALALNW